MMMDVVISWQSWTMWGLLFIGKTWTHACTVPIYSSTSHRSKLVHPIYILPFIQCEGIFYAFIFKPTKLTLWKTLKICHKPLIARQTSELKMVEIFPKTYSAHPDLENIIIVFCWVMISLNSIFQIWLIVWIIELINKVQSRRRFIYFFNS
jgi:hypothetical protein